MQYKNGKIKQINNPEKNLKTPKRNPDFCQIFKMDAANIDFVFGKL